MFSALTSNIWKAATLIMFAVAAYLVVQLNASEKDRLSETARATQVEATLASDLAEAKLEHSNERGLLLEDARMQSEQYRKLEKKYSDDLESIRKSTTQKLLATEQELASVRATADRLSATHTSLVSEVFGAFSNDSKDGSSTGDSVSAGEREARSEAGTLLAELYRRITERARQFAGTADTSIAKGEGCEASYASVQNRSP